MDTPPIPHFSLWVPAVEAGLLPLQNLVRWADDQIARLSRPPLWLIELSLATNLEGLRHARCCVPEGDIPACGEMFNEAQIYLGALYLAYQAGRFPMDKLLREAGQFADCHGHSDVPECEAFYLLLNEIDGGGPTRPSSRPLPGRVHELFAPMAALASAALVSLPGGPTT